MCPSLKPCIAGRLDADTTGLVLITTYDGQWSHKIHLTEENAVNAI